LREANSESGLARAAQHRNADRESNRFTLRKVLEGQRTARATLAIGPEGGWTDAEFAAAKSSGFVEASLGGLILRAETAVMAALASLNYCPGLRIIKAVLYLRVLPTH